MLSEAIEKENQEEEENVVELGESDNDVRLSSIKEAGDDESEQQRPRNSRRLLTILVLLPSIALVLALVVTLAIVLPIEQEDTHTVNLTDFCEEFDSLLLREQTQYPHISKEECYRKINEFQKARDKWKSWTTGTPQDYDYIYWNNIVRFQQGKKIGYQPAGNCNKARDDEDLPPKTMFYGGIDHSLRSIERELMNTQHMLYFLTDREFKYHPRYGYPWYYANPGEDYFAHMTPYVLYTIEQKRLNDAIEKWKTAVGPGNNESYNYTALVERKQNKMEIEIDNDRRRCSCRDCTLRVHGIAQTIAAIVQNGKVTMLQSSEEGLTATTVQELFGIIQDAITSKSIHALVAEYDEVLGYPTALFIGRGFDCLPRSQTPNPP